MDTYVYRLGQGLYINLTNACNNDCAFCERQSRPGVAGYRLWLEQEPTAQQVLERFGAYDPLFAEALPLTLEEIFIYEMGGEDYAVRDIVL